VGRQAGPTGRTALVGPVADLAVEIRDAGRARLDRLDVPAHPGRQHQRVQVGPGPDLHRPVEGFRLEVAVETAVVLDDGQVRRVHLPVVLGQIVLHRPDIPNDIAVANRRCHLSMVISLTVGRPRNPGSGRDYHSLMGLLRGPGVLCCVLVLAVLIGLAGIARHRFQNRPRSRR
jgi:hypothetical protein